MAGIDPATFSVSDLASLPVLTKDEMMECFDDVVTEPTLTLGVVNDHLEHLVCDGYLEDRFRVLASGGSSGRRGVFVYDFDAWVTLVLMEVRGRVGQPTVPGSRIASLFSDKPAHISGALHAFLHDPAEPLHHLPMTMPLDVVVDRLNAIDPALVQGYPTALNVLVAEARAGRLHIAPAQVRSCGELLTTATRRAVRNVWGTEIADSWGVSEGVTTSLCGEGALHLPDDLVIVEPVDERGQPTAPGKRAAKIYLTNLYNLTQPLIRYEITDSMVVSTDPCRCGSAHSRITEISGRLADVFVYPNGATLHAAALENSLFRDSGVIEYRIRQTSNGVEVVVRTDGGIDLAPIRSDLYATLCGAHLVDPDVVVLESRPSRPGVVGQAPALRPLGADAAVAAPGPPV